MLALLAVGNLAGHDPIQIGPLYRGKVWLPKFLVVGTIGLIRSRT